MESEELLLRNTFLNAQTNPDAMIISTQPCNRMTPFQIQWSDEVARKPLAVELSVEKDLINQTNPKKVTVHLSHSLSKSVIKVPVDPHKVH